MVSDFMKGKYNLMIYVGIDISKLNHFATAISSEGEILIPIKTSPMRKNNIRKTKTDKVDTFVIARTLMMQDSLRFISFYDLDLMDLKALGRFRQKTIKQEQAKELRVLAQKPIGANGRAIPIQITQLIRQIELLDS